ncbi:MAG: hypothetical protein E4H19_06775 [Chromatiales bacterium]|nr:MAG: hypothetical protein E4H19_06775 [Chromatiales bacterium]
MFRLPTLGICLCAAFAMAGCSTGAKDGAARGAKTGAVGGLLAGAVGSIFWGGDAVNNALRTAAVGAASGAAVGAMNGAERDKRQPPPPPPAPAPAPGGTPAKAAGMTVDNKALKAQVGDLNFSASEELARCRHVSAISRAEKAFASETDAKRKGYALLIQAMAAEESNNATKANAVYAQWGQFDPARADPQKTRNEALEGLLKLQKVRQEQGLPVLCT